MDRIKGDEMKPKKMIFLLLLLFCLTGCTLHYDLKINMDHTVEENMVSYHSNDEILSVDNLTPNTFVSQLIENLKQDGQYEDYDYEEYLEGDSFGIQGSRHYKNVSSFLENSKVISLLYDSLQYEKEGNVVTLRSVGTIKSELFYSPDLDVSILPEDCYVALHIPFKVKETNADYIDTDKNVLYWYLDEQSTNKEMMVSYYNNKYFSCNPIKLLPYLGKIPFYLLTGLIVIVIAVISFIVWKKIEQAKRVNDI